mmetsp:Transcript_50485/g.117220  ORF Transcript_50485/g.117220 Transcript_50485/m.117220 type:complete len:326 (-) Transcript_50485:146-1123(-)|eukprot:CAMPEP_0171076954 /NCGR_PEP_ID=MMETSP0766_2-20121228/13736_1 /TAXON_ID=439317 /ORGANISM="Gambierdiscus australes, Strain CAWD 149" /LENGTH=325 /DNA_ID=CAMNT_0011533977 /DNA_START=158 /DNA_END=1135 /DNA_ORIENTATION=+
MIYGVDGAVKRAPRICTKAASRAVSVGACPVGAIGIKPCFPSLVKLDIIRGPSHALPPEEVRDVREIHGVENSPPVLYCSCCTTAYLARVPSNLDAIAQEFSIVSAHKPEVRNALLDRPRQDYAVVARCLIYVVVAELSATVDFPAEPRGCLRAEGGDSVFFRALRVSVELHDILLLVGVWVWPIVTRGHGPLCTAIGEGAGTHRKVKLQVSAHDIWHAMACEKVGCLLPCPIACQGPHRLHRPSASRFDQIFHNDAASRAVLTLELDVAANLARKASHDLEAMCMISSLDPRLLAAHAAVQGRASAVSVLLQNVGLSTGTRQRE